MGVTMAEKKKIAAEFGPRYRKAKKSEKSRILDEYLTLSGGKSRKYAVFKPNRIGKTRLLMADGQAVKVTIVEKTRKKRGYRPSYDTAVAATLELLRKNFNRPRGKLFAPFLRQNLDLIRLRKKHRMADTLAAKLKKISPRSIDRLPRTPKQRMNIRGTSGTGPVRLRRRAIHIVTRLAYARMPSGRFQIDPVRHDGGNPSGEFCRTLTMTGVQTGWTIRFALMNKAATRGASSPRTRRSRPFPWVCRASAPTPAANVSTGPLTGGVSATGQPAPGAALPAKTTIALSNKKITPRPARLPAVSAVRERRKQPPSKPSMTPTTPCSTRSIPA